MLQIKPQDFTKKVYQKPPFSAHSHKRPKIKVPRLLHLPSFGTAELCAKTNVYGTVLFQEHCLAGSYKYYTTVLLEYL